MIEDSDSGKDNGMQIAAPRPWVRYWARMFDIYIFALFAGILLGFVYPAILESSNDALLGVALIFAWIFVETILLCVKGTTPGKSLLKVRISKSDGGTVTFNDALTRSFRVWWRGMGVGIPLVGLFTMIRGYQKLSSDGESSWDRDSGFIVTHEKIGFWRISVVVTLFMLFLVLIAVGSAEGV